MKKDELLATQKIIHAVVKDKLSYKLSFSKETTPLTKEICFGVCRNFYALEEIAAIFVKKKPKDLGLWIVILIGIYQLRFLSTPEYAVVKETVGILKSSWEKNFVNAVLRNYIRNKSDKPTTNLEALYNHPLWFIDKIQKSWPQNWQDILMANNERPPLSIRVNNSKITTDEYLILLKKANLLAEPQKLVPSGVILAKPVKVTELPGFTQGLVSVQDLAAQLAAVFLDLSPGLNVLDACAAPGGKTCHILEIEKNLEHCLAIDIATNRAEKIHENLKRLNLSADIKVCDCLDINKWWDGRYFDRILLDAPCSATGVIRRNPDIRLIRTPSEIASIVQLQKQLLTELWKILKPGGKLVYTTCSILPEENHEQIKDFLAAQPDCKYIENNLFKSFKNHSEYGLQILTGEHNMDGFFYSILSKNP